MMFLTVLQEGFPVSRPIDDKLMEQIANGDEAALHTLYEGVSANVYGFVLSITKNTHDAEDVLQETFLTVYSKAAHYVPNGKPMAWILTIAKNHALQRLRRNSKIHLIDEDKGEVAVSFSQVENSELRIVIETAFKILTDEERQILMLHAVGGMKHREIALIMDLSLNTVLSKYHRAIKKMKSELGDKL